MRNGTPDGHGAKQAIGDRKSGAAGPGTRDLPDSELVEKAKRRRVERAELELAKARKLIEVQGKVSALLNEFLTPRGAKPDEFRGMTRAGVEELVPRDRHPQGLPGAELGSGDDLSAPTATGAVAEAGAHAIAAQPLPCRAGEDA